MTHLDELRRRYPWPAERPDAPEKWTNRGEIFGWFNGQNRGLLKKLLTDETKLVVELGALLGLSTRYLAEWAPNATIVTIDHWKGSREHQRFPPLADVLDNLFEVFCVHLWDYRDRVIPMRTTTLEGMLEIRLSLAGLLQITPEVVYIDASHETGPIYADTMLAMALWPDAHIVGDDGGWKSIQAAHLDIQRNTDRKLHNHGCAWEIPPLGIPPTLENT